MLIDYLRYVAFRGSLQPFFTDQFQRFVDPSVTTGLHLRFDPLFLSGPYGPRDQANTGFVLSHWRKQLGATETWPQRAGLGFNDDAPWAVDYQTQHQPRLQIVIDVEPRRWNREYMSPREYEGVPIVYRPAAAARAHSESGQKIFDDVLGPSEFGTLCGTFLTGNRSSFGLTCGHVAAPGRQVLVRQRRKLWSVPLWSTDRPLGRSVHWALPQPGIQLTPIDNHIDAALIDMGVPDVTAGTTADIRPISTMLQEDPVFFRGSGRPAPTLARVAGITVQKSIDLLKDGHMRSVGDVLMLGHPRPMYLHRRVSQPGDSGAAVRQARSSYTLAADADEWHGMILGSDDSAAYATYAERLWAWASMVTGDAGIEFVYDID